MLVVPPKLLLDELVQGRVEVDLRVCNSRNGSIFVRLLQLLVVEINKVGAAGNLRQRDCHLGGIVCGLGVLLESLAGVWLHFLRVCGRLGMKLLMVL